MDTLTEDATLDWKQYAEYLEAEKRFRDVDAIHEQRERDRQQIWDWQHSDDPFLRAKFRAEWPQADVSAAQAESYLVQARQRLAAAEQAAKAAVQPLWDDKFREAWLVIEQVLTGPLTAAIQDLETLSAGANQKNLTVPIIVPANLATDALPTWVSWVRNQLGIDR